MLQLRLFLIIAMVLLPMQQLLAMQTGAQSDESRMAAMVTVSDADHNDILTVLDEDCSKHSDCGDCQNSVQCGNCSLLLGMPQTEPTHSKPSIQILTTFSDDSFFSTDLLPDYRPPRFS